MHQDIHRLLQLKRYECPPEGYFEQFLEELHTRQRAEVLTRSPLDMLVGLFEDMNTWVVPRSAYVTLLALSFFVAAGILIAARPNANGADVVPTNSYSSATYRPPTLSPSVLRSTPVSWGSKEYILDDHPPTTGSIYSF